MKLKLIYFILFLVQIGFGAETIRVVHQPGQSPCQNSDFNYTSIQSAVDAATDDDVILICKEPEGNSYNEAVEIEFAGRHSFKNIILRGEHYKENDVIEDDKLTILSGEGLGKSILTVTDAVEDFYPSGSISIQGIEFTEGNLLNEGQNGGALNIFESIVAINNCLFKNNSVLQANGEGGAIFNYGVEDFPLEISNTNFVNNSAKIGGAIASSQGLIIINRCLFVHNFAFEGAAISSDTTTINVANCIFNNNRTENRPATDTPGSIFTSGDFTGIFFNCLFYNNEIIGGNLFNGYENLSLVNTTFVKNEGSGDEIIGLFGSIDESKIYILSNSIVYFSNSNMRLIRNVEGEASLEIKITNNFVSNIETFLDIQSEFKNGLTSNNICDLDCISGDLFIDEDKIGKISENSGFNFKDIFNLHPNSEMINYGNMESLARLLTYEAFLNLDLKSEINYDLAKDPRIQNGQIDIGAYEFQGVSLITKTKGTGTIEFNPNNRDVSEGISGFEKRVFAPGQSVILTATKGEGHSFSHWEVEETGQSFSENPLTINIPNDRTVTAVFVPDQMEIIANSIGCGTTIPSGRFEVDYGTNSTLSFQPDPGCIVSFVQVDGKANNSAVSAGYYTFNEVKTDHVIAVTFVPAFQIPFSEDFQDGIYADLWTPVINSNGISVLTENGGNKKVQINSSANSSSQLITRSRQGTPQFLSFEVELLSGEAELILASPNNKFQPVNIELQKDPSSQTICLNGDCESGFSESGHTIRLELTWLETQLEMGWSVDKTFLRTHFIDCNECLNGSEFSVSLGANPHGNGSNTIWDNITLGEYRSVELIPSPNGKVRIRGDFSRNSGSNDIYVFEYINKGDFPLANLSAQPNPGYWFKDWLHDAGNFLGNRRVGNVTLVKDILVSASFEEKFRTVTINWPGKPPQSVEVQDRILFNPFSTPNLELIEPIDRAFCNWDKAPSQNQTGTAESGSFFPVENSDFIIVTGGNITLNPVFQDPRVEVMVRENRQPITQFDDDGEPIDGELDISKPGILVKNPGKVPLKDIEVRYYFHAECRLVPQVTGTVSSAWQFNAGSDLIPIGGNNYYVRFAMSPEVVLNPGDDLLIEGFVLDYPCEKEECETWNLKYDYSLANAVPGGGFVQTNSLPVCKLTDPDCLDPIPSTTFPALFSDPPPNSPPNDGSPLFRAPPITLPEVRPNPNLTVAYGYDAGNMIRNGSFELGKKYWRSYPDCDLLEVYNHQSEFPVFDGRAALQIKSQDPFSFEGAVYEIPETDPAFETIVNQPLVFGVWIRGAVQVGTVRVGSFDESGGLLPVENTQPTLDFPLHGWQFLQTNFDEVIPYEGEDGIRKVGFVVFADIPGEQSPFQIDGATLTPGTLPSNYNIRYSHTDTRGVKRQEVVILSGTSNETPEEGSVAVVSSYELDELGRDYKQYLPYATPCAINGCASELHEEVFFNQIEQANQQYTGHGNNPQNYPDAGGYAYTEKKYEHDQITTVITQGSPGENFSIPSGHTEYSFYSGVSDLDPDHLKQNGGDFKEPGNKEDPRFAYQYIVDAQGYGHFEWKNGFGQVVQSANNKGDESSPDLHITQNVYDERGNVVEIHSPSSCKILNQTFNCIDPTLFTYDQEDRLIREISPDAGMSQFFYDLEGNQRASQNEVQWEKSQFSITVNDIKGRVLYSGFYDASFLKDKFEAEQFVKEKVKSDPQWPVMEDENLHVVSQYFYDVMPERAPELFLQQLGDPQFAFYPETENPENFIHTKSRLCAIVTYLDPVRGITPENKQETNVISYQYDRFGRVVKQFQYNSLVFAVGFKRQKIETEYDVNGRQILSRYFQGAGQKTPYRQVGYQYNSQGQVELIKDVSEQASLNPEVESVAPLAEFEYFKTDLRLKTVTLNGDFPMEVAYLYHITGGIKQIEAKRVGNNKVIYRQNLYYDEDVDEQGIVINEPQFNGNISAQLYSLAALNEDDQRREDYQYDRLNRLTEVTYELMDGVADNQDKQFDVHASYGKDGQILNLRRGANATSGGLADGQYIYKDGTHQLQFIRGKIENEDSRAYDGTLSEPNFEYDKAGRMSKDKGRSTNVTYDHRGLPLSFIKKLSDNKTLQVVNRYDHSGNRVSKFIFDGNEIDFRFAYVIIDQEPTRIKDYETLEEAIEDVSKKAALLSSTPQDGIAFYYIWEGDESPNLMPMLQRIRLLGLSGANGETEFRLRGVEFGSPEYEEILAGRQQFSLDNAKLTHYTGMGNEVREDINNGSRVLVNLPQGLGRFSPEGSGREYFLKNHLGSTVITANSDDETEYGVNAYFAYGKKLELAVNSGEDVTETFTGKELDEEIGLFYFGARYYDPEIGLWISPDPERQFHSPYSYTGNGYNPVNAIDPDGKKVIYANAETHNAVIREYVPNLNERGLAAFQKLVDSERYYVLQKTTPAQTKNICSGSEKGGCAGGVEKQGLTFGAAAFENIDLFIHELSHLLDLDNLLGEGKSVDEANKQMLDPKLETKARQAEIENQDF